MRDPFAITKINVEIVRIVLRSCIDIILKYSIDHINDQKSGVCLFDVCEPSFKQLGTVQL